MSDAAATPPADAPTAAPAPADSLIHDAAPPPADPAAAPAPAPAAGEFTFAEKVLAKTADGSTDWEATARKAEQARQHLEKRLGTGDVPPADPTGYSFQMPEEYKDFELKGDRINAFKAEALQHGITGKQFEFMMSSYLKAVPDLMEGAAKLTADQARAELQGVWSSPGAMDTNLGNATRAIRALPADLQDATREFGTNPAFLRAMAHFGAQMREDRPPADAGTVAPVGDVRALQASEAYRNPRHPDHARVSAQVREFYGRAHGTAPV